MSSHRTPAALKRPAYVARRRLRALGVFSAAVLLTTTLSGCGKVDALKEAVKGAAASAIKNKLEDKVEEAIDEKVDETIKQVADNAEKLEESAPEPGAGDYDEAILTQLDEVARCKSVYASKCPPYKLLEDGCKAAYKALNSGDMKATDAQKKAYAKRWLTLLQGLATAKHHQSRYAAAYLANMTCVPPKAMLASEVLGQKLLRVVRAEGDEGYAAAREVELLSKWWRGDFPKLNGDMLALMTKKDHPGLKVRRELVRTAGWYIKKRSELGKALIELALNTAEDKHIRSNAAQALWQVVKWDKVNGPAAKEAMIALIKGPANTSTLSLFRGFGYLKADDQWPLLVSRWRDDKTNKTLVMAMGSAAVEYGRAPFPARTATEASSPRRLAAYEVAKEVIAVKEADAFARTFALNLLQFGGHPHAKADLKRLSKDANKTIARYAARALKGVKPVDPLLVKALKQAKHGAAKSTSRGHKHQQKKKMKKRAKVRRPRARRPNAR